MIIHEIEDAKGGFIIKWKPIIPDVAIFE